MHLKKSFSRNKKKEEEENPFSKKSVKTKSEDQTSFLFFVKSAFRGFSQKFSSDVGFFGRNKIHIRFLRQTKRVIAAGLFFLYVGLGFVSISTPFSLLFFVTSFLFLDYLWKSRHAEWKKQK